MSNNGTHSSHAIPFLDLITPHRELEAELTKVFQATLHTAGFIGGPVVESFEREFGDFCDASNCVGTGSGTDALRFALAAAGVSEGDVVVTVPNTFIATTEAISQVGAVPEFVEIDEATYNMDPANLRDYLENHCHLQTVTGRLISDRSGRPVTAIVPVHLYGQMANMDDILAIAAAYNLIVIEDSCQAHGAQYLSQTEKRWRKAGSMGHAAAFSFYPGKNLGACGEAGAVTTSSEEIAQKVRMMRDHGQARKYFHEMEGYNGRLDALQAGIMQIKLKHLAGWNERRRAVAKRYAEMLAPFAEWVTAPVEPVGSMPVYHLYVVRVKDRDGLRDRMAAAKIGTAIHYPVPLHLQKAYTRLSYHAGDFPITEKVASKIISLPMYPGLTEEEQKRILDVLAEHVEKRRAQSLELTEV